MQSDWNSVHVVIVLDSGNRAFRDEDNILKQIHEKQIYILIMKILVLQSLHPDPGSDSKLSGLRPFKKGKYFVDGQ